MVASSTTVSPARCWSKVATPWRRTSLLILSSNSQYQVAPRSTTPPGTEVPRRRPPIRSRASSTRTSAPAAVSGPAVARPATPAPTTIASRSRSGCSSVNGQHHPESGPACLLLGQGVGGAVQGDGFGHGTDAVGEGEPHGGFGLGGVAGDVAGQGAGMGDEFVRADRPFLAVHAQEGQLSVRGQSVDEFVDHGSAGHRRDDE